MITVHPFSIHDEKRWDEYVLRRDEGTIFHQMLWKRIIERSFGFVACYLLALEGDKICGVLPLFHVRSRLNGNNALISTPFAVYGGILADTEHAAAALIRAASGMMESKGANYIELHHSSECHSPLLQKRDTLYVTFRKNLHTQPEANFQCLPKEARRLVRKGESLGLTARFENDLDSFHSIYAASVRNLGTPVFSKKHLSNCLEATDAKSDLLLIYHQGTAVAGVLTFYSKDTAYPYYGGSLPGMNFLSPNNFMYWSLMKSAAERGYRIFDFGRSKQETGAFAFKRHLGFEPIPLPYQYYVRNGASIPNNNPTNPKYRYAIRLWRRLPLRLTKWIGPRIVRAFP